MGVLGNIKGRLGSIGGKIKKSQASRKQKKYRQESRMLARKSRFLPELEMIAGQYGAEIDALDTAAYIHKKDGNRERGAHIPYGMNREQVYHKLDIAFSKSATTSKIIHGITRGAQRAKEIREELHEAGVAVKGAMGDGKGNMYEDPSFGRAFSGGGGGGYPRGCSSSGSRKKKKKRSEPSNSLYPDIEW